MKGLTWEGPGDLEADLQHGVEPRVRRSQRPQQPLPAPFPPKTLTDTFSAVKVVIQTLSTPPKSWLLGS